MGVGLKFAGNAENPKTPNKSNLNHKVVKMKLLIFISTMIFISAKCFGQPSDGWLPEKYVNAVLAGKKDASKFLIPVEGFEKPFGNGYILTYKSELNTMQLNKIKVNGRIKYRIPYLSYYINMMYSPKALVDRLSHSTHYLSLTNGKVLLEIIGVKTKEEIYFINGIRGYKFKSIEDGKRFLKAQADSMYTKRLYDDHLP